MNRRQILASGLVVAAVGAIAYTAGSRIQSPADALAGRTAPRPTLLLATVRSGTLDTGITAVGTVDWGHRYTVGVPEASGDRRRVVTRIPAKVGSMVRPGAVLIEVDDRPVIAVTGRVPLLRDLVPGDENPDVVRLQKSLQDAGYRIGDRPGRFGDSTAAAVGALYASAGYGPPAVAVSPQGDEAAHEETVGEAAAMSLGVASGELAFVPRLPLRVVAVGVALGREVEGGVTLVPRDPVIRTELTSQDASTLRPGQAVQIRLPSGGPTSARIHSIGRPERTDERGVVRPITLAPAPAVSARNVGQQVQITFAPPERPRPGVLVPLSALYETADRGVVVRVRENGETRVVRVTVLRSSGGAAMVAVRGAGDLAAGQRVVVGVRP